MNKFSSTWRPACGYICVAAIGYNYLLQPFLVFILNSFGVKVSPVLIDFTDFIPVLASLLGLGTLRSVEKIKGKS